MPVQALYTLIFAIWLPLHTLVTCLLFIYRFIVIQIARVTRPDLVEAVCDASVILAVDSVYTRPCSTILTFLIVDGTVKLEKLRLQFKQQLIPDGVRHNKQRYARLRHLWVEYLGYFFWTEDPEFNLENHVRVYDYTEDELTLPAACTEEDLQRIAGPLIARPYAKGRSPWELLVIPNYRSKDNKDGRKQSVMALRVHHALADGLSLVKLVLHLFEEAHIGHAAPKFPPLSSWSQAVRILKVALQAPFVLASKVLESDDRSTCWHPSDRKLTKQYYTFFSDPFPIERMKKIAKKHGVTYNAALYTVTAGAVLKMMEEAGQKVPHKMTCLFPQPLPDHPGGMVNYAAADAFTLYPRAQGSSPQQRLNAISRTVKPITELSPYATIIGWLSAGSVALPARLNKLWHDQIHVTMAVTNVPAALTEVDVMGEGKIVEWICSIGHSMGPTGAAAVMMSAAGRQRVVLTVDRAIYEGYTIPKEFRRYIDEEIEQLLA